MEIPKALGLISVSCSLAENPADVLFEKDNIEQLAKNWYKMSDSTDFTGYKRIRLNTDGKERYYGDELKQHCQTHRGSWFNEFSMLLRRGVQTAYRDKVFTYGRFIAWGGCSLLMGQLYLNIGQDGSMIFSNTGFLYILITAMLAAPGLMAVMQSEKKLKNLTREFVNSWYVYQIQ